MKQTKRILLTRILLTGFTAIALTAYLISGSAIEAQRNPGKVQITDRDGKPVVLYQESHALVIWAGNYQHWSKLNNVEGEAKQVEEALNKQGFQVTIKGNLTGDQFKRTVDDFIASYGYKPNNRLVIFYTGHGNTRPGSKGYLVPIDAPDPTIDEPGFLRVAISMENVMTWAKIIESKHVLFVFDSCFSGTLFKTKSPPNPSESYIRTITDKPVRQFLTAGDAGEEVPAKSVFTPLFISAVEGDADLNKDGYVTGSELGVYLPQTLPRYTENRQSPQYGKIRDPELDSGDIVFSLKEKIDNNHHNPRTQIDMDKDDGATVPWEIEVKGKLDIKLEQNQHLWLTVHPEKTNGWYPQSGEIISDNDGNWEQTAYIGRKDTNEDVGKKHDLVLVLVDKTGNDYFNQYLKRGRETGIWTEETLPENRKILKKITVIRGH